MTEIAAEKDPTAFLAQIDQKIDEATEKIGELLESASKGLVHLIADAAQFSGPLSAYIAHKFEEWFAGWCDKISDAWESSVASVRHAVGQVLGDPLKMQGISAAYRDAASAIGNATGDLNNANGYVAASWEGRAFSAYKNVSDDQITALNGMAQDLVDGADLMDNNATMLLLFWTKQLSNVAKLISGLIDESGKFGDVANWPTGGAGAFMGIVAKVGDQANEILTETTTYWIQLNVSSAGDWDGLRAQLAGRGLPGDQWPDFGALDHGGINGPWKPK